MGTIINIILFVLILGILVFVHELGHFLTAKKSGVHIYEFSIGMGPIIKTIKGKDGINYSIRALPIGGFVQMAGEIYEDDDTKKIPKDKFMCNKPWWQRLIILCAGVFNNFLLALFLLFFIALIWGSPSLEPKITSVEKDSAVAKAGLKDGDVITSINGKEVKTWDKAQLLLLLKNKHNSYNVEIKHEDGKKAKESLSTDNYVELKKGDTIESIKNKKTDKETKMYLVTGFAGTIVIEHKDGSTSTYEFTDQEKKKEEKEKQDKEKEENKEETKDKSKDEKEKDNKKEESEEPKEEKVITYDEIEVVVGDKIKEYDKESVFLVVKDTYEITVKHTDGNTNTYSVSPTTIVDKDKNMGKVFGIKLDNGISKGFVPAFKYAFMKFASTMEQMYLTLGNLFTGGLSINNLSGPVGIYTVVGETRKAGIENVLFLLAYLSINLGIMNILPIPALDGGHVLFLVVELITRKKVNEKVESISTMIFFVLLLLLMFYITIHDIITLIL